MEAAASENGTAEKVRGKPGPRRRCYRALECPSCDARFMEKELLDAHILEHNENIYECGQCDNLFKTLENLKTHFISLHTVKGSCNIIQGLAELEKSQTSPTTTSGSPQTPTYVCEFCSKICPNKSVYENHLRTHTNERPFKCDQCPKDYKLAQELTIHMRTHTNERPYVCPEEGCGKSFTIHRSMLDHQRRHTKAFKYYCEVSGCGKGFITKQDRDRHEVRGHIPIEERPELPGEKTQCKVCKKWISQKGQMAEHMRTHTKEAPHICHLCGKGFKIASNLKVHLKSKKHTGEPMLKRGKKAKAKSKAKKTHESNDYEPTSDESDEDEQVTQELADLKPNAQASQPIQTNSFPSANFPMYVHNSPPKIVQQSQQHVYATSFGMPQLNQQFGTQVQPNLSMPVLTLNDTFHAFQ